MSQCETPRADPACNLGHSGATGAQPVSEGLPERIKLHQIAATAQTARVRRCPARLLASWQRSEDYGIPLEAVEPGVHRDRTVGSTTLFFQCGNEVLADLHRTLAGEPVSMMLTDADGVVLSRLSGDRSLLAALDEVYLAPGFAYSEREVGTNGLGSGAGRPGADAGARRPALRAEPEHVHLRRCSGARPGHGPVGGQRQPDHVVAVVERSVAGAGAVGGQQHRRTDAGAGERPVPRPTPRGQVFRVEVPRLEPASGTLHSLSAAWNSAVARPGGRCRRARSWWPSASRAPGARRCSGRPLGRPIRVTAFCRPAPRTPTTCRPGWDCGHRRLGKAHTAVIVRDVDLLPVWVAERLRDLVHRSGRRRRRCRCPSR